MLAHFIHYKFALTTGNPRKYLPTYSDKQQIFILFVEKKNNFNLPRTDPIMK